MSQVPLIEAISRRLRAAGYEDIATPFKVAGVAFAFTGAMRGRDGRGLDLILLFDTTTGSFGDRDAERIRQRVEALGRALDVTGSRYVITAVLAGAALAASTEGLAELCRVLPVEDVPLDEEGRPDGADAVQRLEDQILLLLPLILPDPVGEGTDGGGAAIEQLIKALPDASHAMANALVAVSSEGEDAVTTAVGLAVGAAFKPAITEQSE